MPAYSYSRPRTDWKRLKAWRLHYIAKGCSIWKAEVATQKKRDGVTWPPTL